MVATFGDVIALKRLPAWQVSTMNKIFLYLQAFATRCLWCNDTWSSFQLPFFHVHILERVSQILAGDLFCVLYAIWLDINAWRKKKGHLKLEKLVPSVSCHENLYWNISISTSAKPKKCPHTKMLLFSSVSSFFEAGVASWCRPKSSNALSKSINKL